MTGVQTCALPISEILLRRRFEGTTAYGGDMWDFRNVKTLRQTYDFIDDTFVCVKVEGEARVTAGRRSVHFSKVVTLEKKLLTNYFSIKTREALLVVFVRTRPWRMLSAIHCTFIDRDRRTMLYLSKGLSMSNGSLVAGKCRGGFGTVQIQTRPK